MHQTLHATHYFSIRKLRLSKSLPPFGRRVAVRSLRQNLPLNNWNLNVVSYTPHATRNKTPGPLGFGMLLNLLHYRAEFLDSICQC